ncbi:MAG: Rrf2 family transcriptional regulator [Desulfovibrio sp.]|nr:Rrf2 family transcriptional regulator [Desulfovibrio sp.]
MRFSTRTRYGLRFLLHLASQPQDKLLQLGQVAHEENISQGYLEQIVRDLRPLGILHAVRGAGGGYKLTKPPSEINLEEIFQCLEGELSPVRCLEDKNLCQRSGRCSTQNFWHAFDKHVRSFLQQHTLQGLLESTEHNATSGGNHVELHESCP